MFLFLLLQAAATPQADIELKAVVNARSLRIEKKGEAELTMSASPDAGSFVHVEAPEADGARTLRNVTVTVDAEARIGTPAGKTPVADEKKETPEPN
jgi:hypothetical protein